VKTGIDIAEGWQFFTVKMSSIGDLKPSNILFDSDGLAKVADLGLAQIPGGASMRSQLSVSNHIPELLPI
jgi:serine/threonine protein kinase